jgi:dienelactone hydrolase
MHKIIHLILLLCSGAASALPAQSLLDHDLAYGKYAVGFKTVQTLDYTRAALGSAAVSKGRRIPLHIWYPAEKVNNNTSLLYKDLLLARFVDPKKLRSGFFQSVAELRGDTNLFRSVYPTLLQSKVKAYQDAKIAKGTFPIVVFPDQVHLQHTLCEYLASQGYIVVSPVIQGPNAVPMQYDVAGIEAGVADMQCAVAYLRKHYSVQRNFAAIGLGFNASLALALQMKSPEVKAFVSLEGGITTPFEAELIQRYPHYKIERCTVPLLVIHAPHPDVKPELVNRYKYAERIFQSYPQSSEFYFLNFGLWERQLKNIFPHANRGNTWQSFETAAASIKHFLRWALQNDGQAKSTLLASNTPESIVLTSHEPALPLPRN